MNSQMEIRSIKYAIENQTDILNKTQIPNVKKHVKKEIKKLQIRLNKLERSTPMAVKVIYPKHKTSYYSDYYSDYYE